MTAPAIESKKGNSNFLLKIVRNQLFIPLVALLLLVIFNLITDPGFFKISLEPNSDGNMILSGNLITMIDYASELVILAIGMTLVTSASGGQDISVGATIAIAGSTVLRIVKTQSPDIPGSGLPPGRRWPPWPCRQRPPHRMPKSERKRLRLPGRNGNWNSGLC